MSVFSTSRLTLNEISVDDAEFILQLFNDPDCIRFIGDKGLSSIADARKYIIDGPQRSYMELGCGLWLMRLIATGEAVGICGLLKRPYLPYVDIGYGLNADFRGQGIASEAAKATLVYAKNRGFGILQAMVSPSNQPSIDLLIKLGFAIDTQEYSALNPRETLVFKYEH